MLDAAPVPSVCVNMVVTSDCQDGVDWVGGSRMRSELYPPISAAGKAQRRRRGKR